MKYFLFLYGAYHFFMVKVRLAGLPTVRLMQLTFFTRSHATHPFSHKKRTLTAHRQTRQHSTTAAPCSRPSGENEKYTQIYYIAIYSHACCSVISVTGSSGSSTASLPLLSRWMKIAIPLIIISCPDPPNYILLLMHSWFSWFQSN